MSQLNEVDIWVQWTQESIEDPNIQNEKEHKLCILVIENPLRYHLLICI